MKTATLILATGLIAAAGSSAAQQITPSGQGKEITPGECYNIGMQFAADKATSFCREVALRALNILPQGCGDAATSGCENSLINAIEAYGKDCKTDISGWSYLEKEVFKRKTCAGLLE